MIIYLVLKATNEDKDADKFVEAFEYEADAQGYIDDMQQDKWLYYISETSLRSGD